MATKKKNIQLFSILLAFLVMGFGDAVGPLASLAKEKFTLTNFEASIVTFMGFIMFFVLSIPMGIFQSKKGKKSVLLIGLVIAMIGLGLQIITTESYILFLATVLLLGAGNAILQVAGNPIMRDVSAEGTYSRNLVVGQFVKAIGSLSTPLLTVLAASYFNMNWMDLVFPVLTLFIFLTVLNVFTLKVEEREDEKMELATFKSSFALLKNKYVLMMVLGIFFYVGAEVCMSSGIANYMLERFDVDISKMGVASAGLFFVALLIGRLLGAFILNFLSPKVFFVITSLVSIVGMLLLFVAPSDIFGFIIVFLIGFGFANIFPLIFSITIDKMPERSNELSGLMVTAIVGGAIVPSLMGLVADSTTVMIGFIVPIICFVYIFITSLFNLKTK